ncbi:phosphotransferase [Microlunatus soli]|uniref:Phosphotransferase enzyme family protein n=1 Tax=Microlunatus soli TaxID=630515 RepID=A0A1H1ZBI3_9ACTN|nr:Phosphotransferase enzyme family protein [Microlunatus soli]
METLPQRLLVEVRHRYGVNAVDTEAIHGGSASKLWRLDSEPAVVLRLSQYYGLQDQQRSCRIAAELARSVAEVIPAIVGSDGESVFVWNGRPITLWPFVQGRSLDRQNRDELRRAGDLLARLHRASSGPTGRASGRLVVRITGRGCRGQRSGATASWAARPPATRAA